MQVFISYHPNEKVFVNELSKELRSINITPVSTNLQQMFGDNIYDDVDKALRNCDYAILVLSEFYIKDEWMQQELFSFLMRERVKKIKFIIPVIKEDCEVPAMLKNRICANFYQVPFDQGFGQLVACLTNTRQVFVVMPLSNSSLNSTYKLAIKPTFVKIGYSVVRADENSDSGLIVEQVLKEIAKSSIVLVELSDERPNCYFEAGYAFALEKEIILTARKETKIHFDLQGNRIIKWENGDDLADSLAERLEAIQLKVGKNLDS